MNLRIWQILSELKIHSLFINHFAKIKKDQENTFKTAAPILIKSIKECTLFFNSWFESGNLREVEKISDLEYNLYLNYDFNTLNYTQWYYFSVKNLKKGKWVFITFKIRIGFTYKFNIMNLQKDESSYSNGMKPFVHSVQKNLEKQTN